MPETRELISAVNRLNETSQELNRTLKEDYPKRREIEHRFITKEASRIRVKILVAAILAASVLSFFTTVTTVSTCFLGDPDHPYPCNWMPGYEEAQQQNREILREFRNLQETTRRNEERLDNIQGR